MNDTIINFLENNDINPNSSDSDRFNIKSEAEINPILDKYFIPGKRVKKEISIANILGYSYEHLGLSYNLIHNLSHFFDHNGSTYQTRSLGMLKMSKEDCVETLKNVSIRDTVYVKECEKNKYIITTNGMHRFHVLRFHYLNELSKINPNDKDEIKKLNQKYTIPVEVQETDYIKTYSYYILRKLIPQIKLESEYDSNWEQTGNVILRLEDKEKSFNDEELLTFLQKVIQKNQDKVFKYIDNFKYYEELLPTFKKFLEDYQIDLFSQEVSI